MFDGPSLASNIDPVCGKKLSERDPQRSSQLKGRALYFCSKNCKQEFDRNIDEWTQRLEDAGVDI